MQSQQQDHAGDAAKQSAEQAGDPFDQRHAGEGQGNDIDAHHGPGGILQPQPHGQKKRQHGSGKGLEGKQALEQRTFEQDGDSGR